MENQAEQRRCRVCAEVRDVTKFPPNRPDGTRHHRCRSCQAAAYKKRYHADTQRRTLQIAYSMNGSVLKRFPGTQNIAPAQLQSILLTAQVCHYCLLENDAQGKGFQLDHIVPLSKGGQHCLENIVLCCDRCNRAKWNDDADDFQAWLRGVVVQLG